MSNSKYNVKECIFMLDCARKYFSPEWFIKVIDEIAEAGFTGINIHFSEEMALRLESKTYPWLAGGDHKLCSFGMAHGCPENDSKYITQDEMRKIVLYAKSRGLDVIPSLDSPGHMTYSVKKYKEACGIDIGNYFTKNGIRQVVAHTSLTNDTSQTIYSRGIDISNPIAREFAKNLYTEYGKFFRELGCDSFDIGGDELLGWGDIGLIDKNTTKWCNLDHWKEYAYNITKNPDAVAYDAFILYINEITDLLLSMGYKSILMWNDDVYRKSDTEWKEATQIHKAIDIQFWSPHTNNGEASAKFYIDKGHSLYNFTRLYTYYTLYPDRAPSYATPEAIMSEWNPYLFAPNNSSCQTDDSNSYIFPPFNPENKLDAPNDKVKGAGFCLWCDTPNAETEDELLEHLRPFFIAIGTKSRKNV